ncbi:MAG TPA: glucose 1-dehydrogenase [Gemmatimonadota bacterium]|nr:glucose 1-dehydrogenase [Gemmatimonadota bacterium]
MTPPPVGRLLDLSGRAAIVTGAGGAIGGAIARRLAEAGAAVAVHWRSSEEAARQAVAAIEEAGGSALALRADLGVPDDVERFFDDAVAALGRLDVLVNNAGAYLHLSPLAEMSHAEWDTVLRDNLTTVHLGTRAAARRMTRGAIVNVASIEALQPMPDHIHYVSAKAAVLAHTRAAAQELGPRGIRVNAVSPGLVDAGGLEAEWPHGVERWRTVAPMGLGGPEDVADACLFLASDAARWITGANLIVDGGGSVRPVF